MQCHVPPVFAVFRGIWEAEGVTFFSALLQRCYRCGAITFCCNSGATELWLGVHCLPWPWKITWVAFHQINREPWFGPKQDCRQGSCEISMDSGPSHNFLWWNAITLWTLATLISISAGHYCDPSYLFPDDHLRKAPYVSLYNHISVLFWGPHTKFNIYSVNPYLPWPLVSLTGRWW